MEGAIWLYGGFCTCQATVQDGRGRSQSRSPSFSLSPHLIGQWRIWQEKSRWFHFPVLVFPGASPDLSLPMAHPDPHVCPPQPPTLLRAWQKPNKPLACPAWFKWQLPLGISLRCSLGKIMAKGWEEVLPWTSQRVLKMGNFLLLHESLF